MTWKNSKNRYGNVSIIMHWLMVLLMVLVFASIEARVFFEKGTELRDLFKMWHFMLGLLVLLLVIARVYLRFVQVNPAITPPLSTIQNLSAKLLHLILYAFMICMPIMGWLVLSAAGKPVPFFGLELPALIGIEKPLAGAIVGWHKDIGQWGYYLIGFHAVAALVHHYVQKDDTLMRMLPNKK